MTVAPCAKLPPDITFYTGLVIIGTLVGCKTPFTILCSLC